VISKRGHDFSGGLKLGERNFRGGGDLAGHGWVLNIASFLKNLKSLSKHYRTGHPSSERHPQDHD
jgi:hypothetical protein